MTSFNSPQTPEGFEFPGFYGRYTVTADAQRRITIPQTWRSVLTDLAPCLLLTQLQGRNAIGCYPPLVFARHFSFLVQQRLHTLRGSSPMQHSRGHSRLFHGNVYEVVLDPRGRLLIPAKLWEAVGLDAQIILEARWDSFELWNATAYQARTAAPGSADPIPLPDEEHEESTDTQ